MKGNLYLVTNHEGFHERLEEFIFEGKNIFKGCNMPFKWEDTTWCGFGVFKRISEKSMSEISRRGMDSEFSDFAKSFIIHRHILNPLKSYSGLMAALRLIEYSLVNKHGKADISAIDETVFDFALKKAKGLYKPTTLFNLSTQFEQLLGVLVKNGLLKKFYVSWKNPCKLPSPDLYENFRDLINTGGKLSGLKSIEALAAIFAKEDSELSDQDLLTTSVFALLMCAPSRITEILSLPCDCEYHAIDQKGIERVGLRFFSLKGYGANIKWIPTIMIPVAKKAITRLNNLSQSARILAEYIEQKNQYGVSGYDFFRLPSGLKVECKKALCLQKRKRLSKNKRKEVRVLSASGFINDISHYNPHNIFARHGFLDDKNNPLFVNTHLARHLLNTIAYLGGMTDFDIARWSGRKNISQNRHYNHVSREHVIDFMQLLPDRPTYLEEPEEDSVDSVTEPDFSESHGAYLITDYGFCEHDYSIAPCKKYPGFDKDNKFLKEKFELLIKTSDKDNIRGVYGADKWANKDLIFKTRLQ